MQLFQRKLSKMLITAIPLYKNQNPNQIKFLARRTLLSYPMHTNEVALNNYLYQKYQITLKAACLQIILQSNYSRVKDKIIITLSNKKLDNLAHLIMFGDGRIQGSKILQNILK